jgi:lipopolysaccharide transport system permease protein
MLRRLLLPFVSYKYLLFQLFQRDLKARYKQSIVGYAWIIVNPLSQLIVYSFVFSVIMRFETGVPYIVFLYAALLPWTTFTNSLQTATQSLIDNASLLKKVAFPKEVIVYATIMAKVVDFLFSSILFFALVLILRVPLSWTALLFPLLFLFQILFTVGLGLFLATLNLFYRDVQYLVNLLLMLWMYMTPIVYPLSLVPDRYLWLYMLNPMVGVIEGYRAIFFGTPIAWNQLGWAALLSVLTFIIGFAFFKKLEPNFADIV